MTRPSHGLYAKAMVMPSASCHVSMNAYTHQHKAVSGVHSRQEIVEVPALVEGPVLTPRRASLKAAMWGRSSCCGRCGSVNITSSTLLLPMTRMATSPTTDVAYTCSRCQLTWRMVDGVPMSRAFHT